MVWAYSQPRCRPRPCRGPVRLRGKTAPTYIFREWTTTEAHHWHTAACEHTDMVADFGEHTYDENKVCTVCRTQYVSKGLEYTMSANGPHWVVSGIGTCTDTVIYIPAVYNGILVKEIGAHAFHENTTITGVVLPDSITTINAHAFFCCTNLASINLPEGLTTIGEGAFNSVSIASIVIPASVTTIPDLLSVRVWTFLFRVCLFRSCTGLQRG